MSSCSVLNIPAMPMPARRLGILPAWKAVSARVSSLSHQLLCSVWVLAICKFIIGAVAAADTYLTIKYAESLDVYEQNPLGRWLMGLDSGPVCETQQIAAFITAKFLGTIMVLVALQLVAHWRARLGGIVAMPIALFQAALIVHLMFGEG